MKKINTRAKSTKKPTKLTPELIDLRELMNEKLPRKVDPYFDNIKTAILTKEF